MSISTQPNEMLDMILNQTGIPLAQRMRLRAVSPRFNATLIDGLQQERSLVIRVVNRGHDLKQLNSGQPKVQPNDLLLKESHFSKKKNDIDFLHRLFPQATELAINSDSLAAWRKFVPLLRLYTPTLTSLKVDGHLENPSLREPVFRSLSNVINSMTTLSSLYLDNSQGSDRMFQPAIGHHLLLHLGPTISRLESFTLEKPILQNYATFYTAALSTARCTQLRLNFVHNQVVTFPLAVNLTHLHLTYINDSVLQVIRQLPKLTTLILQDEKKSDLDTVLPHIRPPSQLTQVTFIGIICSRPLEPPAFDAFTLPSIKRLTLQLDYLTPNIPFNAGDYLSTLASWFPSLVTCALHTPAEYREGILAIQEGLPFTVELLDNEPFE